MPKHAARGLYLALALAAVAACKHTNAASNTQGSALSCASCKNSDGSVQLTATTPRYDLTLQVFPMDFENVRDQLPKAFILVQEKFAGNGQVVRFGYTIYPDRIAYGVVSDRSVQPSVKPKSIAWNVIAGLDQQSFAELKSQIDTVLATLAYFSESEVRVLAAPLEELQGVLAAAEEGGGLIDRNKLREVQLDIIDAVNPRGARSFFSIRTNGSSVAPAADPAPQADSPDSSAESPSADDKTGTAAKGADANSGRR